MQSPQEHTGSYYAASVNERTNYPQLQGMVETDICIVGAGFTGVSTALHLAEQGYDVVVLEANRVGWGASGRNGGQIIGGFSGASKLVKRHGKHIADMVWDMRWAGNDIIRQRVEHYGIKCDLKSGYIDVALKDRQMDELQEDYDELAEHQFRHEFRMVSKSEIEDLLGTRHYVGGLINKGNGHLHPLNLCIGEAKVGEALGVRYFEQSPVMTIDHGPKPVVRTANGQVAAETVVLAGNAYHTLERGKLSGLVFPANSFVIATEPLSDEVVQRINSEDLAVCDVNNIVDYYRLSADNRLLFGGVCNYSGREPRSIRDTLLPRLFRIYPELEGVQIDYEWGGKMGIVINRIPTIGRIDNNIYYAQGYSGHGVNVTHMMSKVVSDAISGTLERFDLFEKINHFRVPGSQWVGNQLVAIGMLYYRLRDLI